MCHRPIKINIILHFNFSQKIVKFSCLFISTSFLSLKSFKVNLLFNCKKVDIDRNPLFDCKKLDIVQIYVFILKLKKNLPFILKMSLDLRKMMEVRKRYMHQPLSHGIHTETNTYFNYNQKSLRGKTIPGFAKIILDHPYFSQEQKQKFVDEFLLEYLNNPEYQDETFGKYLVFNRNNFVCVMEDLRDLYKLEEEGYRDAKYTVPIGYVEMRSGMGGFSISCDRPEPGEKIVDFPDGPKTVFEEKAYMIDVGISVEENPTSFYQFIEREMMYNFLKIFKKIYKDIKKKTEQKMQVS